MWRAQEAGWRAAVTQGDLELEDVLATVAMFVRAEGWDMLGTLAVSAMLVEAEAQDMLSMLAASAVQME